MIQQMSFEMKKYIFRRSNALMLGVSFLLLFVLLLFSEWKVFWDKSSFRKYLAYAGDSYTEELKENLQNEYALLGQELYTAMPDGSLMIVQEKAKAQGVYGETRIADYALLRDILECIETVEQRNQTIQILLDNENGAALNGYYVPEQNCQLANRWQLGCMVNCAWFSWAACIVVILLLGASFSIENKRRMFPLLCATKKGEDCLNVSKILTGCVTAATVNCCFFAVYLIIQWLLLGINSNTFRMPLFLVDGYELCASGMTVGAVMAYQFIFGTLAAVLAALTAMAFSKGIGKGGYARAAAVLLFMLGTGVDLLYYAIYQNPDVLNDSRWYLVSIPRMQRMMDMEKCWNPFSILTMQYYFTKPRFLTWNGRQYPMYVFPFIVLMIVSGILVIYLIWNKKKKKV